MSEEERRRTIVTKFLELAFTGKIKEEGPQFFAVGCKHHNPLFPTGMDALTEAMVGAAGQFFGGSLTTEHVLVEGDLVAVHTALRNQAGEPVFAQFHLFRFSGDQIVEYWDVTQAGAS
jgi:predicted SnoaL-like aldol condensation-catalyzing enzyme